MEKALYDKIKRYNRRRREIDELKQEIASDLFNGYMIDENRVCIMDGKARRPYSDDGVIPIYEWGSRRFDLANLEALISYIEEYREQNGEDPDLPTIHKHFKELEEKLLLDEF